MDCVAHVGPVYQAGTLSGNPVAVTAGLKTLAMLKEQRTTLYPNLDELGKTIAEGLRLGAKEAGVPVLVNQVGSMVTVFFTDAPEVTNYTEAKACDATRFGNWFRAMLEAGVYWPPSQFEAAFLSSVMTSEDVDHLLSAARKAFRV